MGYWHIETDVFALLIIGILLVKNYMLSERQAQDRWLSVVYWASLGITVIDLVASVAMNDTTSWAFYQATMVLYCATIPLLPCLWLIYGFVLVDPDRPLNPARAILVLVPMAASILASLSNPWTSLAFSLSPTLEYARGPLFMPIYYVYAVYYPLLGIIWTLANRKRIVPLSNLVALLAFFVAIPVVGQLQLSMPGTLLIDLAFAVIYVLDDATVEAERRNRLNQQINEKNAELEAALAAAESASRAKTEFVSRISHDIRTPIGQVLNLTDFAEQDLERGDLARAHEDIQKIGTSGSFLLSLINDVLDISKIDSGKIELREEPYGYLDYARGIQNIVGPMCEEKGIKSVFDIKRPADLKEGEDDLYGLVDKVRLNQVSLNVLSNAVKYTPAGGTVTFRLALTPSQNRQSCVCVEVEDTGIGMSEDFQRHMFEEFSMEFDNPLRQDTMSGTGLGLSLVKKFVDLMQGELSVTSKLGEGTCVRFEVPVTLIDTPEDLAQGDVEKDASTISGTVLLAEDNEINAQIAIRMLQEFDVTVEHAANGAIARDMFAASEPGHYDIVFMDIQMPELDGYEATRAIRALDRDDARTVPIYAVTADAFSDAKERAFEAGMTGFATKPFNDVELRRILTTVL